MKQNYNIMVQVVYILHSGTKAAVSVYPSKF